MKRIFLFILLATIILIAIFYFPTSKQIVSPFVSKDMATTTTTIPSPTPALPTVDGKTDLKSEIQNAGKVDYKDQIQTLEDTAKNIQ